VDALLQDLKYGLRVLSKTPGFTAMAVLTLALGMGASTAVFSVDNAVLLKPLPYAQSDRIVFPWAVPPRHVDVGFDLIPWSQVAYLYFERHSKSFAALGAFQSDSFNLTGSGEPLHLDGMRAAAGFFPALGVAPLLGRTFTAAEDRPGEEHEAILGYGLWEGRFGGDPAVLGRSIALNGAAYTVIGVMPPGFAFPRANEMPPIFSFPREAQLWVPLALDRGPLIPAEPSELAAVGRLKLGVTLAQAQDEMDVMAKQLDALYPKAKGWFGAKVTPMARQAAGGAGEPLLLTLAAVGVVLLIACANVAGLLVTRALGRKREFTLRSALGADYSLLNRQLLTESSLVAGAGGVAGFAVAEGGIYFAKRFGPSGIPRLGEASLDVRVLAFGLGLAILAALIFGLAPAMGITRESLVDSLKEGGQRSGSSHGVHESRNVLVISQVSLALVLVVAAGLLTRTFYHLMSVDPGFRAEHVLTFELSLPATKYPDQPHIVPVYQALLGRIEALPGVESAGIAEVVPMDGATEDTAIRNPGRVTGDQRKPALANYTIVSSGYFEAVGSPILCGRDFLKSDTADSMPVTIISEAMANQYWPHEDPIGKQVGPASLEYPAATVVGIVGDTKRLSLREEPPPEMYVPYTQEVWPSLLTMDVLVRTANAPEGITTSVRDAVHAVDPDLPLANVKLLSAIVADSMTEPRFSMLFLAAFGILALLLATMGMYGVISHGVTQRTQEIGIRMALGAQRSSIFGMVLGQGARLACIGIVAGLAGAFAAGRLMAGFLYGITPADPWTYGGVAVLLALVALAACYVPARHAMQTDPMAALRNE
jgi:predicted permease